MIARSKFVRKEVREAAAVGVMSAWLAGEWEGEGACTLFIVFIFSFVVLAPDAGPFGEVVLRGDGLHLAVQAHDVCAQLTALRRILALGGGEGGVEGPEEFVDRLGAEGVEEVDG